MAIQKLNIPNKTDNAAKKKLVASNDIGVNETLMANEVNALVAKTNELVDAYNFGAPITAFNFKENVATYADLPTIGNEVNDGYGVIADGLVYVWNGEAFPADGDGMDLNLRPTGKVQEGDPMAVAGNEVYKKTAIYDQVISTVYEEISSQVLAGTNVLINSSTFAGWGENKGVIKDFNRVSYIVHPYSATDVPTELRLIIRKGSESGEILYNILKNIEIQYLETKEISFDLPEIFENEANDEIFIQFTSNGYISLIGLPYVSPTGSVKWTAVKGSEILERDVTNSSSMYVKLSVTNSYPIIRDHIIVPRYETVISNVYEEISSQVLAGTTVLINTSTFAGWGENKGVIKDFNRVSYIVQAYSASNIPTEVRLIIRKGSETGEILYNILKTVELQHLESKEVSFDLPEIFENENNDNVFIQFNADGYISLIGTAGGSPTGSVKYTTVKGSEILVSSVTNSSSMYVKLSYGNIIIGNTDEEIERIKSKIYKSNPTPKVLLTSKVWLFPGLQYNIFNKNVYVPDFGDNLNNYRLDFNGSVGAQFNRGFRITATAGLNQNIALNLLKGREILTTKTQNLLSSAVDNGNGVTRNVLLIGDSTINGSKISTPLKAVFDTDVMNINLIGTLGTTGIKHEGRGGWRIEDYYGYGRTLYQINVSGITTPPSVGARYTQGASIYNVEEINITGGIGYFSVTLVSGSAPTASGTLTKTSGSGDASITYSSMSQTSANPFYNPSTTKFDIGYYLTQTGQTLTSGDWIGFQLGINDVFGITTLSQANTKVDEMMMQMNYIISNIHSYNPNIRIALCVTFPPADQDAFAANYSNGQLSEMYAKTGLVTWQNELINSFDNETKINQRIYLVSAHLNLDTVYGYPTNGYYKFLVHGVTTQPATNAVYSINGTNITVSGASVLDKVGYVNTLSVGDYPKQGTLTKISGTGDTTINYYNVELISASNYVMQNNGVHPSILGYKQIAEMYAGLIKYYG